MKKLIMKVKNDFNFWRFTLKQLSMLQRFMYVVQCIIIVLVSYLLISNKLWFVLPIIYLVFKLFIFFQTSRFNRDVQGNGIIYGNKGKGKGLLMQIHAKHLKTYFSNVPMGYNQKHFAPIHYFNVLDTNTIVSTIENNIKKVNKEPYMMYEGVNILWDDLAVYAPNHAEKTLITRYPSAPLMLAINRHLFNHYIMISVQDRGRPWKIIRELSADYSCKALKSYGTKKSFFWNTIPFLRSYMAVKYRWYEEVKASEEGVLPFKGMGLVNNSTKHFYLTSGQATKEQFIATHGLVYHGFAFIKKKHIQYDTRYFHELFFGYKAD